jgi:hypothetical protein
MKRISNMLISIFAVLAFGLIQAHAQPTAPVQTVALSYSVAESLTLTLSTSTLALSQTPTYVPVTATVAYNFGQARNVSGTAWFSNATTALSSGSNIIAPSSVLEYTTLMGETTPEPCNGPAWSNVPLSVAGATCQGFLSTGVGGTPAGSGTLTGTLDFALAAATYPVGSYTGTVNIGITAN